MNRSIGTLKALLVGAQLAVCCLLSACWHTPTPPDYKINPTPKHFYVVEVTSDRQLPSIAIITVKYVIENSSCARVGMNWKINGVTYDAKVLTHPEAEHVNRYTLHVLVPLDKVMPGDYWGLGTCHWYMSEVIVRFNKIENFGISTTYHDIKNGISVYWRCRKIDMREIPYICLIASKPMTPRRMQELKVVGEYTISAKEVTK